MTSTHLISGPGQEPTGSLRNARLWVRSPVTGALVKITLAPGDTYTQHATGRAWDCTVSWTNDSIEGQVVREVTWIRQGVRNPRPEIETMAASYDRLQEIPSRSGVSYPDWTCTEGGL